MQHIMRYSLLKIKGYPDMTMVPRVPKSNDPNLALLLILSIYYVTKKRK